MRSTKRPGIFLRGAVLALLLGAASMLPAVDDGAWMLTLPEASSWQSPGDRGMGLREGAQQRDIQVQLLRRDGAWQEAWLLHPLKPGMWLAAAMAEDADGLQLRVELPPVVAPPGGFASGGPLSIELNDWSLAEDGSLRGRFALRSEDASPSYDLFALTRTFDLDLEGHRRSWAGNHRATLRSAEQRGRLTGKHFPLPLQRQAAQTSRAEHPRLLFSAEDLPALRQRAEDPVGRTILERLRAQLAEAEEEGFGFHRGGDHSMQSSWAVGLGLLYHLSGDAQYAATAQDYVWSAMYEPLPNLNQWRQSHRILGVALAYDLFYHDWPEDFRKNVYHYLLTQVQTFSRRRDLGDLLNMGDRYRYGGQTTAFRRGHHDAEARRYQMAAAVAALAIANDEPPIYTPPEDIAPRSIAPDADYQPPPGVPVLELPGQHMFARWLINGPFADDGSDPLTAIGGLAQARPRPGTVVKRHGVALDFRAYHPAGQDDQRFGPRLYPRDCARFYGRSTGNGYWPGRLVQRRAAEAGERGTLLTWYTVWHNDEAQLVQAFPNWYWQSRGVRMWLAGEEVVDGEVIAVEPGYYPVMVSLPQTGGYAVQAPHLRWYSEEEQEQDRQRAQAARERFAASGDSLPLELARGLAMDLRHHLLTQVDAAGWLANEGHHEHLWAFLNVWLQVTGEDLIAHTGVAEVVPLGIMGHQLLRQSSANVYAAAHAGAFVGDDDAAAIAWLLANDLPHFRRPVDYLIPFIGRGLTQEPRHPQDLYPLVHQHPQVGVDVMFANHARAEEGSDLMVSVNAGGAMGDPSAAGALHIAGVRQDARGNRGWLSHRGHGPVAALESGSAPLIAGLWNRQPAQVRHRQHWSDGSSALTLHMNALYDGELVPLGRSSRQLRWGDKRPRSTIQRAVFVDYSGAAGAPGVILLADRFRGVAEDVEKYLQFYVDTNLNHISEDRAPLRLGMEQRPGRGVRPGLCEWTLFTERPFSISRHARNQEGTSGILRVTLDPQPDRDDQLITRDMDRGADRIGMSDDLVEQDELLDDLMGDMDEDLAIPDAAAEADDSQPLADDVLVLSALVISSGKSLPVQRLDENGLQVGEAIYRYDGRRWQRSHPAMAEALMQDASAAGGAEE